MNPDELADEVIKSHERCKAIQADLEAEAGRRADLIRQALAAGAGAVHLADTLGVSRGRIYHMAKQ
ncbi:hypothetical protein [Arthrobacter castelli]|uniref:hypothetical protein n=1 Tax=Arthrobacter castelli TaxID=271431 RepID=UPI00041D6302|nr:hypothetical protein [Arthrobacter castelli]